MEKKPLFRKSYIFMSAVIVCLPLLLLALPDKHAGNEVLPVNLLQELGDNTRFLTTDDVAKMLINNVPYLQLIDVRSEDEFAKFSLPGAINIPLEKLLDKQDEVLVYEDVLKAENKTTVFYSTGTVHASQAWILCRRMAIDNIYVLKGGLNEWAETILQPKTPGQMATSAEMANYKFRSAASLFFTGASAIPAETSNATGGTVKVAPMKKKKGVGGGC